jgi:hypothetical protein
MHWWPDCDIDVALPARMQLEGEFMTPWEVKAKEFATCNCDYGCPCQFNAYPTHGNCQAIAGIIIEKGHHGDVTLDGLTAVGILSWPKAIHEGNGEVLLILDERADEAQRNALLTIMGGEDTDPFATMWNVFASTMDMVHEPVVAAIDIGIDVDGRVGHIKIADYVEVSGEPIRNPVSGEEHRARIDIIGGFEYELAEMGSGTARTQGPIEVAWEGAYGQFANIHLNNHGVISNRAAA